MSTAENLFLRDRVMDLLDTKATIEHRMSEVTADIDAQIADLSAIRDAMVSEDARQLEEVEEEIKASVLSIGVTVTGKEYKAVYSDGRVTWDTKGLDGYAVAHPEISAFKREGKKYVYIRKV